MTRSAFEHLIDSNNHGVDLMSQGKFLSARQAFYEASDVLKAILDDNDRSYFDMVRRLGGQRRQVNVERFISVDGAAGSSFAPTFSAQDDLFEETADAGETRHDADRPNGQSQEYQRLSSLLHQHPFTHLHQHQHQHQYQQPETSLPRRTSKNGHNYSPAPVDLFIFLRPIMFSTDVPFQKSLPSSHILPLTHLSICILFNLALSNHALALDAGLVSSADREAALKEAIHIYHMTYSLQVMTQVEVSRLYTLAMINNLGQLFSSVHDDGGQHEVLTIQAARECFTELARMISVDRAARRCLIPAIAGGAAHLSWTLLEDTYMDLFLDNVFLMGIGYAGPCQSAAA